MEKPEKVFIDGVEYVPKDEHGVTVQGITYDDIPNWLYNVRSNLVHDYCEAAKQRLPSVSEFGEKVSEFDRLCETYLGYKFNNETYRYEC